MSEREGEKNKQVINKRIKDLYEDMKEKNRTYIKLVIPDIVEGIEGNDIISHLDRFVKYKLENETKSISRLTIETIQKGRYERDIDNIIPNSLLYFLEIQDAFEYVKGDFKRMKEHIEKIKKNEELNIETGDIVEFKRVYSRVFAKEGEISELLSEFKNAKYISYNSTKLSTPETRKKEEELGSKKALSSFDDIKNDENIQYKRQYLLEFLSYIYIKKKKELDKYFYYIEKLYELSNYDANTNAPEGLDVTQVPDSSTQDQAESSEGR